MNRYFLAIEMYWNTLLGFAIYINVYACLQNHAVLVALVHNL